MKFTYKLLIIMACCMSVQTYAVEKVSTSELLDRYAANQDKLKSFIARTETTITQDITKEGKASHFSKRVIFELRYEDDGSDFRAYFCPKDVHSAEDGSLVPADRHTSSLWDGERYFEHHRGPVLDQSSVFISFSVEYIKDAGAIGYAGPGSIRGLLYGDVERIDSILRQADSITVRDELERVGSGDCYVIDAKTKHGTYTIWLDPERGYGIAKVDIHKGPKDLWWGRPLDYFTHAPYMPNVISIRNVRFESIEDIWVPMEVDIRIDSKDFKGTNKASVTNVHYKVKDLLLNPDHDVLGSFVPDIENGTKVYTDLPGLFFAWHNGKKFVVDKWDGSIKYVPKDWSILVGVGKPLPQLKGVKLKLSAKQTKNRAILICFFDMNQRPSRYCVRQLAQKAAALKEKGIIVAAVQTSQVTNNTLNEWAKTNNILFPVGAITADIEKTRFTWGVRSLPWLILSDNQHIVTAEGFGPKELNDKIKATEPKPKAPANKCPSALDLLDRYAANQDKLKSFIVKTETISTYLKQDASTQEERKRRYIEDFRYKDSDSDLIAYYSLKESNLGEDGIWVRRESQPTYLWESERYYQYHRTPILDSSSLKIITSNEDYTNPKRGITILYSGADPMLGLLSGDIERFDSIFKQSNTISARNELERVGSVDCYVIDAKSEHGTYTVWLDPEHGYGIAKAELHKGPEDLIHGRPPSSYKGMESYKGKSSFIENVRFKNIEGIWIHVKADIRSIENRQDIAHSWHTHYQITQIDVNPDHDELQSFVLDVQNGTRIKIIDEPRFEYVWDDGKKFVEDEWDGSIRYVPKDWSILVGVGKLLPQFEGIKLKLSAKQTENRAILLCFFDMNQRPSRYCVKQLTQKAAALKEKGITVVAVQASQVKENTLNAWTKKYNIPFPVGAITADIEKTCFAWGVRSLPWLILTDKGHVIRVEGFGINTLEEKLKKISPR